MKLLLSAAVVATASGVKFHEAGVKSQSAPLLVTKYTGASCSEVAVSDIWTVSPTSSTDLTVCTRAAHATPTNHGTSSLPSGFGNVHTIGGLTLLQNGFQALHLTCHNGTYAFGAYVTEGNAIASCSNEISRETFSAIDSNHLAAGSCADSIEGNSYRLTLSGLVLPDCSAGVVGDPHLTNLHGEKFDIHDGLHRLVHYPRGASQEDALFMVDARAVDMGKDRDCYSVYLDSVKLSGKWVGDEISVSSSMTGSSPDAFFMSFANERMDWPTMAKRQDTHLNLKGTMPVTVTTSTRKASGEDAMGGQELTFKVGEQSPVLVQVWSSKAHNALTREKEVRYLNVQIKNLPDDVGGIIGLDSYSRPSDARCELVQEESDLLDFVKTSEVSLLRIARPKWSASASVKEQ